MKLAIGLLLMFVGVCLGVYVGVWVCFIGGIVDLITEIRADDLAAPNVAFGIAKVMFAGVAGWLSAMGLILPGYVMVQSS